LAAERGYLDGDVSWRPGDADIVDDAEGAGPRLVCERPSLRQSCAKPGEPGLDVEHPFGEKVRVVWGERAAEKEPLIGGGDSSRCGGVARVMAADDVQFGLPTVQPGVDVADRTGEMRNPSRPADEAEEQIRRSVVAVPDGGVAEFSHGHASSEVLAGDGGVDDEFFAGEVDPAVEDLACVVEVTQYGGSCQRLENRTHREALVLAMRHPPSGAEVLREYAESHPILVFERPKAVGNRGCGRCGGDDRCGQPGPENGSAADESLHGGHTFLRVDAGCEPITVAHRSPSRIGHGLMRVWYKALVDLITHLRSFIAVADAGSFTAGAADIRVPQPVVSRRVMTLERTLGRDLFVRSARQPGITDVGRRLLPHAIDLVARADRFLQLAAQRDDALRVGIRADADIIHMATAARAAHESGLRLEVVDVPPLLRKSLLDNGELHLALVDASLDTADVVVPLGAASLRGGRRRSFYVDELRRSRTEPRTHLRRMFLCPEDDVPDVRNQVSALMARAGLSPTQLEVPPITDALTRVHAHGDVLLCPEAFAGRHSLTWRPFGAESLHRCYAIKTHPQAAAAGRGEILDGIVPALLRAVGGVAR
jgi:DNA-binding transcriptional LysR family regulator